MTDMAPPNRPESHDAAYAPRPGLESLRDKIARNGRMCADEAMFLPGWEEVRVLMRQLEEAERVLRVVSGWNTDRVDAATAIQPALAYFANRDLEEKLDADA